MCKKSLYNASVVRPDDHDHEDLARANLTNPTFIVEMSHERVRRAYYNGIGLINIAPTFAP